MSDKFITFNNLSISIQAEDPKKAYDKLCEVLKDNGIVDWYSDTYTVNDSEDEKPTEELWGD